MKDLFKEYLFTKYYLVADASEEQNTFEVLFSIANLFGVKIVEGKHLANRSHINFLSEQLGEFVPQAFYQGFPQSVLELTAEQLLFDQLVHYYVTYGFGNFDNPGHSLMEKNFERIAFNEDVPVKEFSILTEQEATKILYASVADMLASTRPLSKLQLGVIKEVVADGYKIVNCASKNTAIKLLLDLRDIQLANFLSLSDVIKVVEQLNFESYSVTNIKKLNFKNQDRKFITKLLDYFFERGYCNILDCYTKQALWCGLLHHLHYKPKNQVALDFVNAMRSKGNKSVYSQFERLLTSGKIKQATLLLKEQKGENAILRNLNYILSRCKFAYQVKFVLNQLQGASALVLLQLASTYAQPTDNGPRAFKFIRFGNLVTHTETQEECDSRKSHLSPSVLKKTATVVQNLLQNKLKNKFGKVYVASDMIKKAIPLQEGTSMGGVGVMAKGSRIPLPSDKKVRAFTYWEKVNDIDLSVIGLKDDGDFEEFSWRTMYGKQSACIVYSGDQTSGFDGGSEYFDVDLALFKKNHPNIKYLVFCDNVFSEINFDQLYCKAGYMLRDIFDSGEVFEPKTVQSSYKIDCQSTFACMFALDLTANEFVWLNTAMQQRARVAGTTTYAFLDKYLTAVEHYNLYWLFDLMAKKVVQTPDQADLIVSDHLTDQRDNIPTIHSYDFEKILKLFE